MITDDQLEELDTCKVDWGCYDRTEKYAYARRAIALALQVKPLDFKSDDHGSKFARTSYGEYWIYPPERAHEGWLSVTPSGTEAEHSSEEYAIKVAQDIHKEKILRELVHGGNNGTNS